MKHNKTPNPDVVTGNLKPNSAERFKRKVTAIKSMLPKRTLILGLVFMIVLISSFGYLVFLKDSKPNDLSRTEVCTRKTIGYEPKNRTTESIKALAGYENDPNCLYLLLENSIAAGDPKTSRQYFDSLEQKSFPNEKYLIAPATGRMDLNSFRTRVEDLERLAEELNKNTQKNGSLWKE